LPCRDAGSLHFALLFVICLLLEGMENREVQFLAPPCRCCCTACRFKRQARARQALIWDVHNSHVAVAAALQTKTYHMAEAEDNVLEKAEGTKIEWAAGKNPTVKVRCCRIL